MGRAPGTGGGQIWSAPTSSGLAVLADLTEQEREQRERWSQGCLERERHFIDPPRREFEHEASCAHRGAVISLAVPLEGNVNRKESVLATYSLPWLLVRYGGQACGEKGVCRHLARQEAGV